MPRFAQNRKYPVNSVIEDQTPRMQEIADRIYDEYAARQRAAGYKPVPKIKIHFFAVNQCRGRAYWNRPGWGRVVTIPVHAIKTTKVGYLDYYVAHEMAHHYAHQDSGAVGHCPRFMTWMKRLCPAEHIHYELGYIPRAAAAAGIHAKDNT